MSMEPHSRQHRSFTLIELLVVISIIAVFLGISIPVLVSLLIASGQTKSLANCRSIGQTLELFANQNKSKYPFYELGTFAFGIPPDIADEPNFSISLPWDIDKSWPILMHGVAPWDENYASWMSPGREPNPSGLRIYSMVGYNQPGPVSYQYSNSFIAAPNVWNGRGDATEADIKPTFQTDVAFPSSKVIMLDFDRAYLKESKITDPRPLLFADSSASARLDSDATRPVSNPLYFDTKRIYHCTPDGVLGRDF